MNDPVCQLDDFHFRRLSVEWHDPKVRGDLEMNCSFDYDVAQHSTETNRYRLDFSFKAFSGAPIPVGYVVDVGMAGFFRFPRDMEPEKMDYLIRVNGCTILYGILRGQIASLTGVFPQRKLVLPTFMMKDVVDEVEKAKAKQTKPEKKSTKTGKHKKSSS